MRILTLLLLVSLSTFCFAQKLVSTKVGDDITIKIPSEFINMSDQDRMRKFATSRVPLAMYSTQMQDATLGINDNPMQWAENDTQTVYGFYKASVNALFDEIEFIQDTIKKINGKEFIVFEFTSVVRNDNTFGGKKTHRNYSYIQYTSHNDQVLLFNFGCSARIKNQWEGIANEMMDSIKIN